MARFVSIENEDLRRFERDLRKFAEQAMPFANRGALNDAVFTGRKVAQEELQKRLTIRNKWTLQSVRVEKATQRKIRKQRSVVGAVDQYLERTEFGGTESAKGKHGRPIPTRFASGEERGSQPRERAVTPRKTQRVIKLRRRRGRAANRRQRNLVAVRMAAQRGRKFIFLSTGRAKGIFQVTGGPNNPEVEMVWDLSRRTVHIPANPWLKPTMVIVQKRLPGIYRKNLKKQLIRRRLFKR